MTALRQPRVLTLRVTIEDEDLWGDFVAAVAAKRDVILGPGQGGGDPYVALTNAGKIHAAQEAVIHDALAALFA
jgi:hypothetical protein